MWASGLHVTLWRHGAGQSVGGTESPEGAQGRFGGNREELRWVGVREEVGPRSRGQGGGGGSPWESSAYLATEAMVVSELLPWRDVKREETGCQGTPRLEGRAKNQEAKRPPGRWEGVLEPWHRS